MSKTIKILTEAVVSDCGEFCATPQLRTKYDEPFCLNYVNLSKPYCQLDPWADLEIVQCPVRIKRCQACKDAEYEH